MSEPRRWTLHNEGEHQFSHLSYDGPPIQVDERVEVVEAAENERLREERDDLLSAARTLLDVSNPRDFRRLRAIVTKADDNSAR